MRTTLLTLMTIAVFVGTALGLVYLGLNCAGRRSSAVAKKLLTASLASLGAAIFLAFLAVLLGY
jgi:hypothetical protein